MIAGLLVLIFAYSSLLALVCIASLISDAREEHPAQHVAERNDAFLLGLLSVRENYPAIRCERGFHERLFITGVKQDHGA